MDYEKIHKDTIAKLQEMVNSGKITVEIARGICADFIPESDDERIRKEMIFYFKEEIPQCSIQEHTDKMREFVAWLEKQGEQKTAGKVEPKFKIGDIIRFKGNETLKGETETHKIISYDNELYVFADGTTDLFCEQDLYELVERKPAWSKEDDEHLERILKELESQYQKLINRPYLDKIESDYNWLKSLKERYTWKPNDKQMDALKVSVDRLIMQYPGNEIALESLYQDLKKLKGE